MRPVAATLPAAATPPGEQTALSRVRLARVLAGAMSQLTDRIPHRRRCFATAMPDFDLFPRAAWSRAVNCSAARGLCGELGYSDPCGLPQLRRAIASHLAAARGIACEPEQVIVFCGAQQAIHFLAGALLDPGDAVWFEDPGAVGARNSFIAVGARLVPVPVDRQGLDVAAGLAAAPDFRLAFVTPTHQQPLAAVMSLERRLQLLAAARAADAIIIEDDYDGDFYYGRHPIPALKSIDRDQRVIYVGSFSKTLYPSLRLGYAVVPTTLVDPFSKAVATYMPGASTQIQAVVAAFMDSGQFAIHLRTTRRAYRARCEVLLEAGRTYLGGAMTIVRPDAGLHTIGLLEAGGCEDDICREGNARDITVTPLSRYSVSPLRGQGFVLGFSAVDEQGLVKATRTLAAILDTRDRRSTHRGLTARHE